MIGYIIKKQKKFIKKGFYDNIYNIIGIIRKVRNKKIIIGGK